MYIFGELISYIKELVQTRQFHPTQNSYKMIFTREAKLIKIHLLVQKDGI